MPYQHCYRTAIHDMEELIHNIIYYYQSTQISSLSCLFCFSLPHVNICYAFHIRDMRSFKLYLTYACIVLALVPPPPLHSVRHEQLWKKNALLALEYPTNTRASSMCFMRKCAEFTRHRHTYICNSFSHLKESNIHKKIRIDINENKSTTFKFHWITLFCCFVCAFSVREHTKKNLLFHYFDNSGIDIKSRNCGVVTRPTVMATGRLLVAFYFFVFFFVRIVGCFHCESTARNGGRVLAEDRGRTVMCGDRYWRTDNISAYLTVPHSQSDNVGACTHCLWRITN